MLGSISIAVATASCWSQQTTAPAKTLPAPHSIDVGVTYSAERTHLVPNSDAFWLQGGGVDGSYNLWNGFGAVANFTGDHISNYVPGFDVNKLAYLGGPRYTFTTGLGKTNLEHYVGANKFHYQIFAQGLFGGVHAFNGFFPAPGGSLSSANSFGMQLGGGVNLLLTKHYGIRLFEADYVRTDLPNNAANTQNDMRLSAGVTYHIDLLPPPPITLVASASPSTIFAGDPVTLTATAGALQPKLNDIYSWSGSGVTGNSATTTISTANFAPGTYTVKAQVKEGKAGKEGLKPWQAAEASTSFTVKPFDPPTISCSANPSSVNPGDIATITIDAVSPQNRALTYSYNATAGSISGITPSATLATTAAAPGPITVTCGVSDDKGHTVTAAATVNVIAPPPPPPPPAPLASSLCPVSFERDIKRPTRVDNEAKACLDDIALSLERSSDAKLALVGNESAKEQKVDAKLAKLKHHKKPADAALRAVNTKEYLVIDKGIDATRIAVYTGTDDGKTVATTLIPVGATNPVASDATVDETVVKAVPRHPLKPRHHRKK
jgi:hypothetical protein